MPQPATLRRLAAVLDVPVPVLENLGELLAAFQETLQASPLGAFLFVGSTRSTARFTKAVHAALSRRFDELAMSPAEKELILREAVQHVLADLRRRS